MAGRLNIGVSLDQKVVGKAPKLDYAKLENAKISGSNLENISMRNCDLSSADLSRCRLDGVDLRGIEVNRFTKFDGAFLKGAKINRSVCDQLVKHEQLNGCVLDNIEIVED